MKMNVLYIEEITKDDAENELYSSNKLTSTQIDEYLDVLIALKDGQFVYNILTPKGYYLLYVTAKPSTITKNNKVSK
jgi:hypothetical protein